MSAVTDLVRETVATTPILEVEGLTKHFPVGGSILPWGHKAMLHAVDDVSFSLRPGQVTALVGESGSGKSTVARLLARLYPPTGGTIRFRGENILEHESRSELLKYRADVQMIFQDPFGSLNPVKRVKHHLVRPLRAHHIVPHDQIDKRVLELLTTVGLVPAEEFARKYPHQLSGGQRQRISIARGLAVEPDVILADEPISMLDVSIRMGILNLILKLKNEKNIAFLYITHDIASARYVADEMLVMYAGQVVEKGETDAVIQTPAHPYTRLLLSAIPNPERGTEQGHFEAAGEAKGVIDPKDECRFVSRCPVAVEASHCRMPRLVEIEPNHWVRCHLYPGA
ncbi:MAG TPA: ABC transporter ATP-binding protein [Chloroflexi bacterium]|jgi:peptide/nickel transport system ATP-binding protein|nr:ABC transporter ATP-binding protein [Chloroflexota bacterium]